MAATSQASVTQAAASTSCPWVTSRAPVAQRVAQLMSQMSLADEITMVEGHGTANPYVFYTPAIPSLCIPAVGLEDGPSGVADGLTGVTQLPAGVALAATWDPSLARQYGQVIGAEEYGKGASANLGPTVNIDRDPRWGRSFEALSEDPSLNASLDVPEIAGVQSQDVEAQVKHLADYNQETYRNTPADNVIIDPRTEHEIYLPSFYAAVKSGAASVMCSYAVINGDFACNNSSLETTILRDQWGFPGFVMSDYGALHSTQGAVQGTDQEQPFNTYYGAPLQTAVQNGTIPKSVLNTTPQDMSWWSDAANGWTQTAGRYRVYVGDSSALAGLPLQGSFTMATTPAARQVVVSAPSAMQAGKVSAVRVTLTAAGNATLHGVRLALQLPQGWRAVPTGPTVFGSVAPGTAPAVTFLVRPPSYAPNADAVVHATATMGGLQREAGVSVTVSG